MSRTKLTNSRRFIDQHGRAAARPPHITLSFGKAVCTRCTARKVLRNLTAAWINQHSLCPQP